MLVRDFYHKMRALSPVLARHSGLNIVFKGDMMACDGVNIYYPTLPLQADMTPEFAGYLEGGMDHEAGHERNSTMSRIIPWYKKNHHNGREKLNQLHNSIEDVWMEQQVIKEYPGSSKNLKVMSEFVRKRELRHIEEGELIVSELHPSDMLGAAITIAKNPDWDSEASKEWTKHLEPNIVEMGEHIARIAREECECTEDCITLAKKLWTYSEDTKPEDMTPEGFDKAEEDGELDDLIKDEGDGAPSDEFTEKEEQIAARQGKSAEQAKTEGTGGGECLDVGMEDVSGDGYMVYSTKDDKIIRRGDRLSVEESVDRYHSCKSQIRGGIMTMKNKLRRALIAKQEVDWDYRLENGDLDGRFLYRVAMGHCDVYKRRVETLDENTAISILIDLSGSMAHPYTKSETARDCAIALAECFEGTGFRYRIAGYRNGRSREYVIGKGYHRYEPSHTYIFKDFDEPLRVAKGMIASIPWAVGGNNSDYDFISSELYELSRMDEDRKVLFVISDGCVLCDSDFGSLDHEKYIRHDILEYRKKHGVETVGIGLLSDAISDWCDKSIAINKVEDLSGTSFNLLTKLLVKKGY